MPFTLPDLPYSFDSLEPHIDTKTMEIHHDKHHAGYVKKLNAALEGTEFSEMELTELITNINNVPEDKRQAVINHGGGHINHSFWWKLLKKDVEFRGEIAEAINNKFVDFETFKEEFEIAALGLFGSGWCWLVLNNGELEIITTNNQNSPLMEGQIPILGIDLWEHSFYLKHGPNKPDYLDDFFSVINWDQVNENYRAAKGA